MKRFRGLTLLALAAAFASGCLAPKYTRPSVVTVAAYKEAPGAVAWKAAQPADFLPKGKWWSVFGDPRLSGLEERVSVSNQNVAQAEAQFREAMALVRYDKAQFFPSVTANGGVTRELNPGLIPGTNRQTFNVFNMTGTADWELNLWGAYSGLAGAKASAQASAADLENMRLSMQAQLASDYFSLEELDMEKNVLDVSTAAYQTALDLTLQRFHGGVASEADVTQARTQLDSTRAQATALAVTRAKTEHAIAVLVGQTPSVFSLSSGTIAGPPPPIPSGIPATLIQRRPDVAAAERTVMAANETIGVARSAYFPTVTLTATGGYQSGTFADWLLWPSRFWSLGASAAETVLDFGRRKAQVQQARAAYDASAAAYRQTALAAFQSVEDSLSDLANLAEEAQQQDVATKEAEKSLALEMDRYKGGVDSYLSVIQTQTIALTNERASVQILGQRMAAAVSLIEALGGGWDESQLPFSKPPVKTAAKS